MNFWCYCSNYYDDNKYSVLYCFLQLAIQAMMKLQKNAVELRRGRSDDVSECYNSYALVIQQERKGLRQSVFLLWCVKKCLHLNFEMLYIFCSRGIIHHHCELVSCTFKISSSNFSLFLLSLRPLPLHIINSLLQDNFQQYNHNHLLILVRCVYCKPYNKQNEKRFF